MKSRFFSFLVCFAILSQPLPADPSCHSGQASYYHDKFQGQPTASGEPYLKDQLTAAHRTLPFGTLLRVTRLDTMQSVEVRVNDRGPHSPSRVVDLSRRAAEQLDLVSAGVAEVEIEIIDDGSLVAPEGDQEPPLPTPVLLDVVVTAEDS